MSLPEPNYDKTIETSRPSIGSRVSLHSIQHIDAIQTLYRDYETIKCLT
jgi:hypothetical protein